MMSNCFFKCGKQSEKLITSGAPRIRSIIAASHQRGDNLYESLQSHLDEDSTYIPSCAIKAVFPHTLKKPTYNVRWVEWG